MNITSPSLKGLSLPDPPCLEVVSIDHPVLDLVSKYRDHPSIKKIRETSEGVLFELQEVTIEEVEKTIH